MNYKILVNKNNKYNKEMFSNIKLYKVINLLGEEYYLEKQTLRAYLKLKKDLEKENIIIDISSGYRTIEDQEKILFEYKNKYSEEYVSKYVALPSFSEHHTALCFDIDLIINGKRVTDREIEKYTDVLEKIISMLDNYGLILRYPKEKEKITLYNYEPWHYRYVGISTAKIIKDNDLTLEEYDSLYNKSGIIIVNKPKGLTSRDVVDKISKIFDTKKVGHNGTLDPLATGVLVITINKATKINELLTSADKEYIATVKIGIETDTLDITGKVVKSSKREISKAMLDNLFREFPRKYDQEVPKYSAIKINGKKLYEYARNNEDIELPKREVEIKDMELLKYDNYGFTFRIVVSKGTYIRSIIRDMGRYLDIPCTMKDLIRTRQGKFSIDEAWEFDNVDINIKKIKIDDVLPYEVKEVRDLDLKKVINGNIIDNIYDIADKVIFKKNSDVLAVYKRVDDKLKPYKILV